MKRIAVFPGSFDPITKGHEDVMLRGLPLFDEVIVAIGVNSSKKSYYSLEKRKLWIEKVFEAYPQITVESFTGMTIDFCRKKNAKYILRGLRTPSDFEYETLIAQNQKILAPEIETIFIPPVPELMAVSSTVVRDVAKYGGDVSAFIPACINLND